YRIAQAFHGRTQPQWTKIFFWQLGGRAFNFLRDSDDNDNWSARPAYYTLQGQITDHAGVVRPIESDFLGAGQSLSEDDSLLSYGGEYRLIVQTTGNAIIADQGGNIVWPTGALTEGRAVFELQLDGNLVLRDLSGLVMWESGTSGYADAYLNMD